MKKIHLLLIFAFQLIAFENYAQQVTTNLILATSPPATLATWSFKKQILLTILEAPYSLRGSGIEKKLFFQRRKFFHEFRNIEVSSL